MPRAGVGMVTVSLRPYHKGQSLGSPSDFEMPRLFCKRKSPPSDAEIWYHIMRSGLKEK